MRAVVRADLAALAAGLLAVTWGLYQGPVMGMALSTTAYCQ